MKYFIVPKKGIKFEVEGMDAVDALVTFATFMDMDMGMYFEAIPENEIDDYNRSRELEEQKKFYCEWAEDVLLDVVDTKTGEVCYTEDNAKEIAEMAWALHCDEIEGGDGLTDYECIAKAMNMWEEGEKYA